MTSACCPPSWHEQDGLGFDDPDSDNDLVPVSPESQTSDRYNARERHEKRRRWAEQYRASRVRQARRWAGVPVDRLSVQDLQQLKYLTDRAISCGQSHVRKGIPSNLRPRLWAVACSAPALLAKNPGEYARLVERATATRSSAMDQIDKDLRRTFPNHPFYRTDEGIRALRHCLLAFAARNPHIGYSQSMNFLAGLLNLLYAPEMAFWMMVAIVERILPRDFYDQSLLGCRVEIGVLRRLVTKKLPEIDEALRRHRVDITVVCVGWFLCLFVNTLPIETVLRVWDCFLVEGDKILFRVGLALLKMHSDDMLACTDSPQMIRALTRIGKDQYDCDTFLQAAFKRVGSLKRETIVRYRQLCREEETNLSPQL